MENSVPNAIQVQWKTRSQAVSMAACLLASITTTSPTSRGSLDVKKSLSANFHRVLSDLTRFWHSFCREVTPIGADTARSSTLNLFLSSLRSFCIDIVAGKSFPVISTIASRFVILLAEVISTVMKTLILPVETSVEAALCLILIEITAAGEKSRIINKGFVEHLLPAILSVKANLARFDGLGLDLQVFTGNLLVTSC